MLYVYLVTAVVAVPILDRFVDILHNSNSWWITPLIALGIFIGLVALHFGVAVLSIALIRLDSNPDKNSRYIRGIVNLTLPMFFKLALVKISNSGLDKVPCDSRFLLVCNHLDNLDPAVILSVLPECELGFVGKKEIYTTMPLVARAMHKLNSLPIDRENDREAVKTIVKASKTIKEDRASMAIFPEGYTSATGELLPLRNGAFKIAYKANVPIVVAVIGGTKSITKNMFRRKTKVYFDIVETIMPEEFLSISSKDLGDRVYVLMKEAIDKRKSE